ncbi:nuclease-related domain-containing protein [Sporosarcina gallistercoris]|uniref:nuclease-related domain-containing protein n=1 Tax=Sporosarcina gallistercoris TaxID=2762245 RepID=UPI003D2950D6
MHKHRTVPKLLSGLFALERRLPRHHEKYKFITEELYNTRAGYSGELEYDRYMKEVQTDFPHAVLHDLSLHHEGVYFQIDSLFITPDSIFISEIKNRADRIIVTANPTQFLQVNNKGESQLFRSPIAEVERKVQFLRKWLGRRNVNIPVKGIIVFAYNNQMQIEGEPRLPIYTSYEAPTFFRSLKPEKKIIEKRDISRIAIELARSHREYNPYPLVTHYKIQPHTLKKGVFCSTCTVPSIMIWTARRWECRLCGKRESDSHMAGIEEWFMLMPHKLTNQAFCEFTGIKDRHTAKRLLARSKLKQQGIGRGSYYELIP